MNTPKLSREIGFWLLLFYGLGNILGAGIYVLIGKVAGIAGYGSIFSFLIACVVSVFTALSYTELVSRYPFSAGVAVYIKEGIGSKLLAVGSGIFIALAGLISAAALSHGFVGYLSEFISLNESFTIVFIIFIMIAIAINGIKTSVTIATIFTIIEIFGLFLIIYLGFDNIIDPKVDYKEFIPTFNMDEISIIFLGSFLAFYAFIGFEDMVTVSEEVNEPSKNFPRAIIWSLVVVTIIYSLIVVVSLQTLSIEQLSNSNAPLADVYESITNSDPVLISFIGLFAVINGALIQIIMASRIVYGLSNKGLIPKYFDEVSQKTKTPIKATILVGLITIVFALFFDIVTLAGFTSILILIIFTFVNISLIRIKLDKEKFVQKKKGMINIPIWVPFCGVILNIILILFSIVYG